MGTEISDNDLLAAKRHLAADLKAELTSHFTSGEKIEAKATDLFKLASGILGFVTALKIAVVDIRADPVTTVSIAALLLIYAFHVYYIYQVLRPRLYTSVPGIPRLADITEDEFREVYIEQGESEYLEYIIVGLAGTDEEPGAIEDAEMINDQKAKGFERLGLTFVLMIFIQLIAATLIVFAP